MTTTTVLLATLGFGLAYANGANDVSKGIATLVGAGLSDIRRAILWGTLWTALGGLLGATLATAMVATFGNGLLAPGTSQTLGAGVATLLGASGWVLIATRTGLPVSTTHAIVGSLVGVATIAYGWEGVRWSALGTKVALPLLLTPALALVLVTALLKATQRFVGARQAGCLCVDVLVPEQVVGGALRADSILRGTPTLQLLVGTEERCEAVQARAARLTLSRLHWFTAGAASFARGMNDAPKIVALVMSASALQGAATLGGSIPFVVVTGGMVLGSFLSGRRVTHTLAEKVTPMDHREGFLANLVTATLVTAGATFGLPMSTTHVSSGGIIGAGLQRSSLNRRTLREMLLAWVVTVPAAALLGILAYAIGGWFW